MEEDLRSHLAGKASLTNLVGQRIQWAVREGAPSLALHLIDAPPDRTLQGTGGLVISRVQADCWGLTFLCCAVIAAERDHFGESPNILFRTRLDLRVSFKPA